MGTDDTLRRPAEDPAGSPGSGAGVETFEHHESTGVTVRQMLPVLIALMVLAWFMLAVLLAFVAGLWGPVLAVPLAGGFGYLLYSSKQRQLQAVRAGSRLELSADGAKQIDRYMIMELRWDQVEQIGPLSALSSLRVSPTREGRAAADAADAVLRGAQGSLEGLIGNGRTDVTADAPMWFRQQLRQNKVDQRQTAVALSLFDPQWRTGRIGQWIRAYRPDLLQ